MPMLTCRLLAGSGRSGCARSAGRRLPRLGLGGRCRGWSGGGLGVGCVRLVGWRTRGRRTWWRRVVGRCRGGGRGSPSVAAAGEDAVALAGAALLLLRTIGGLLSGVVVGGCGVELGDGGAGVVEDGAGGLLAHAVAPIRSRRPAFARTVWAAAFRSSAWARSSASRSVRLPAAAWWASCAACTAAVSCRVVAWMRGKWDARRSARSEERRVGK